MGQAFVRAPVLRSLAVALLAFACVTAMPCDIWADSNAEADSTAYYFYHGRKYGSEVLGTPTRLIVNGGFGILQIQNRSNHPADIPWVNGWHSLWHNLGHPINAIDERGTWDFVATELLPVSVSRLPKVCPQGG